MLSIRENGDLEITDVVPVVQFGEVQYYTTKITIDEIGDIHGNHNRLTYDGDAQRGISEDGNKMIDKKHVNQIYESVLNDNSIRGHLTWNIRKHLGNSDFVFDEKENSLVVKNKQKITLPDSAHRHDAFCQIFRDVDDDEILSSEFTLDIFNLSKEEEKEFFYTVNGKVKAPNKNRTLYLSSDIKCKLIRDFIGQCDLDGKIECVRNNAQKDGKLTKFSTMYESIFGVNGGFQKENINAENYNEYMQYFIDFYNELISSNKEFTELDKETKKINKSKTMITEEITWWGYAYLAKELKDKRNWKASLQRVMNKKQSVCGGEDVFWLSKQLPIWHATVIKPKFNYITQKQEIGVNVANSYTTRESVRKVFSLHL